MPLSLASPAIVFRPLTMTGLTQQELVTRRGRPAFAAAPLRRGSFAWLAELKLTLRLVTRVSEGWWT